MENLTAAPRQSQVADQNEKSERASSKRKIGIVVAPSVELESEFFRGWRPASQSLRAKGAV